MTPISKAGASSVRARGAGVAAAPFTRSPPPGAPTSVRRADAEGEELNLDDVIGDCLRSGDHVYVSTSLGSA